jgi:membrane-associated phospholipid phosphatase
MPAARAVAERYLYETRRAFRSDGLIYLTLAVYLVVGAAYVLLQGGMLMGAIDIYARACAVTYCVILPFIVLVIGIAKITHRLDGRRALAYRAMFAPRRVARFIAGTALMTLVLVPFESMFASVKSAFSDGSFPYDKLAADIDKTIHFGHAPAKYLLSLAKSEWLLRAVESNYDVLWFIVCFGIIYWVAISPRADGVRLRYCASFFFVWVLVGNVAAALFPTAGPAFYGLVTDDPQRFEQLRQFLDSSAGWFSSAADEQHYLWSLHAAGVSGFGSGISAFPSMHVALISLNALFAAEVNRRLGIIAWCYVALILVSSIYLGWHYAIDGYVAIVLAIAIYWGVRRAMPFIHRLADGPLVPGMRPVEPGDAAAAG